MEERDVDRGRPAGRPPVMKDGMWPRLVLRLTLSRRLPPAVRHVLDTLEEHGHEAVLVGGSVRDLFLGQLPKDWDVATQATPTVVSGLFAQTRPTGIKHGTVTVVEDGLAVEVTTYRVETTYSDYRHPDEVRFTRRLVDDLARRDFTINAMALTRRGDLADPFAGRQDLEARLIRAVGDPAERFGEDPLRMMRAIRLAAQLGFALDRPTYEAIAPLAELITHVSAERIREEFSRALLSRWPSFALELLSSSGLLRWFLPELTEGVEVAQNEHHAYPVWEHALLAVEEIEPELPLRLAALFHDVGKPRTLTVSEGARHFFNHEAVGADLTAAALRRLRYDRDTIERATRLVAHHMALHYTSDMTDSAVRRVFRRIGLENVPDLLAVRRADRLGSGTKTGELSRGTQLLLSRWRRILAEEARFGLRDLAIDGHVVMTEAGIEPGPLVGQILRTLFDEVEADREKNNPEYLRARVRELAAEFDRGQPEEPDPAARNPETG